MLQDKNIPTVVFIMRVLEFLQSCPDAQERAEKEVPGITEAMKAALNDLFQILSEEDRNRLLEALPLEKSLPKTDG